MYHCWITKTALLKPQNVFVSTKNNGESQIGKINVDYLKMAKSNIVLNWYYLNSAHESLISNPHLRRIQGSIWRFLSKVPCTTCLLWWIVLLYEMVCEDAASFGVTAEAVEKRQHVQFASLDSHIVLASAAPPGPRERFAAPQTKVHKQKRNIKTQKLFM